MQREKKLGLTSLFRLMMSEQPILNKGRTSQPNLLRWVDRLPALAWVFYLFLWLFLITNESSSKWLDGIGPHTWVCWI
jgi:hypothetical protein